MSRANSAGSALVASNPLPQCWLILGMHRSGTSLLSRSLSLAGIDLGPTESMLAARDDNPLGFFEQQAVVELNDELLRAVGRDWSHPQPLRPGCLGEKSLLSLRRRLGRTVDQLFLQRATAEQAQRPPPFAVKDPRLCLLLPLWRDVLRDLNVELRVIVVRRPAAEVIGSLRSRHGWSASRANGVYLANIIALMHHTVDLQPVVVDFGDLLADPRRIVGEIFADLGCALSADGVGAAADKRLPHTHEPLPAGTPSLVHRTERLFHAFGSDAAPTEAIEELAVELQGIGDQFAEYIDAAAEAVELRQRAVQDAGELNFLRQKLADETRWREDLLYSSSWRFTAPLRAVARPLADGLRRGKSLLARVARHEPSLEAAVWGKAGFAFFEAWRAARSQRLALPPRAKKSCTGPLVLFISGCGGDSRRYRCAHAVEAIAQAGGQAAVFGSNDPVLRDQRDAIAEGVDLLVVQRCRNTKTLAYILARRRELGKPSLFETDDLTFDPAADVHALPGVGGILKARDIATQASVMRACDGALCSTTFLAERLRRTHPERTFVIRNGFSAVMQAASRQACASLADDYSTARVVMGYASGTPTHDRDLGLVEDQLLEALEAQPQLELHLVGRIKKTPRMQRFGERVRELPFVPWADLPQVLRGFHINLAPFVLDEPFTQGKSELKYLEAALVAVPTIASPLPAFVHAMNPDVGVLCRRAEQWSEAIAALSTDAVRRRKLGLAAQARVERDYGPEARSADWAALFATLELG